MLGINLLVNKWSEKINPLPTLFTMSTYLISIQIRPSTISKTQGMREMIAFQEEDRYYLAGAEQIVEGLKSLLPEIESNDPLSLKMRLEIREGDESDADSYQDFLNKIKNQL